MQTTKMTCLIDPATMSHEAIEALVAAIDSELGVCEIEPIMYVKMREDRKTQGTSICQVERFISVLNSIGIYFIGDLVQQRPAKLIRERIIGKELLAYASHALMNLHTRQDCEITFRAALYMGQPMLDVKRQKLSQKADAKEDAEDDFDNPPYEDADYAEAEQFAF